MAYQQQFNSRLLQQVNETNSRNLELQALLAQKDDQLANLNARLSNLSLGVSPGGNVGDGNTSLVQLQRRNATITSQLSSAEEAASNAEAKLKSHVKKSQRVEADLRKQVNDLQNELRRRDQYFGRRDGSGQELRKGPQWTVSTGVAPRAELDAANAEVQRLRLALGSLQRQLGHGSNVRCHLPAAGMKKARQPEDQDDEEVGPSLKQEPALTRSIAETLEVADEGSPLSIGERHSRSTRAPSSLTPSQTGASARRKRSRPTAEAGVRPSTVMKKLRLEQPRSERGECEIRSKGDADPGPTDEQAAATQVDASNLEIKDLQERFEFQAVTRHHSSGDIEAFHSQEDLSDECEDLWARIKMQVDEWVEFKGQNWSYEFQKPGYNLVSPPCMTTKLRGHGATVEWHAGFAGKFACKKCVEEERPCFTWNGEEFWLLPLHEDDRKWPVEEGCEIRYWLNIE